MLSLKSLLPLLLLISSATPISAHIPSRLDQARIRSVHRRHHARRAHIDAAADCSSGKNVAVGGAPIAGRADTEGTVTEVGEVVKDAVEDVVAPAMAKALNAVAVTGGDSTANMPSDQVSTSQADAGSDVQVQGGSGTGSGSDIMANVFAAAGTSCNQGDWKCDGMTLKRCNWNQWLVIRECSGDNVVCSDVGSTVGCVWTWSVTQAPVQQGTAPTSSVSPVSVQLSPSSAAILIAELPISTTSVASSSTATQNVVATTTASTTSTSSASISSSTTSSTTTVMRTSTSTPSVSTSSSKGSATDTSPRPVATFTNAAGEECVEWEEEIWVEEGGSSSTMSMSSWSAAAATPAPSTASYTPSPSPSSWSTPMASSSASPSASTAAAASPSAYADDEDCEEWEDEVVSSSSASSATGTQLGQNLAAAPKSSSSWSTSSSSSHSTTHSTSSSSNKASPTASPTGSPTSSSSMDTGSAGLSTQHAIAATISASNGVLSSLVNPSKTLSVIDVSAISISSIAVTTTATQGVVSGTPTDVAKYSAPHYVIYSDYWLNSMPDVSLLKSFNRFVLAFWMSDVGPVDNAIMWTWMAQADRRKVLAAYHNAGIALMVSAFGSTDQPTSTGKDPLATAQGLAKFVVDYEFDGVDIDYEDMGAMNSDKAEAWLIPFQKELRRLLPKPYLISHAPVAPWFTSSTAYKSGAYVAIHQSVGDGIDFYNMQFYNQGDDAYVDCNTLINQSGGYWPGTSVMEMNSYAKVPLNKIVIGKPLDAGKASNGYMSPSSLNTCVKQARQKGWNGGVMFWEWTTDAPGIMAASRA